MNSLPRFYPIFDDVNWLPRVLPLGVEMLQLRIKDMSNDGLLGQIKTAKRLCDEAGAILIVNDYWELAIELQCDWVHLGQEDLETANISEIRAAGIKIGVSTHDHEELGKALSVSPDYIALGPIYPTILKKMKWHQQGLEKLTEWKSLVGDVPLIAIGGFNIERGPGAFEAGADVVSVVTDITLNEDPEARVRQWLEVCK